MAGGICECGHEKRDHRAQTARIGSYGACRICLCNTYTIPSNAALRANAPAMDWVLERLAIKNCPQGLHVMAEELHWLGLTAMTYEKLAQAVKGEMDKPSPRIHCVAEGVYWFANRSTPAGWNLYTDTRMLPCFYRRYPPAISWEELDTPDNILPKPSNLGQQ